MNVSSVWYFNLAVFCSTSLACPWASEWVEWEQLWRRAQWEVSEPRDLSGGSHGVREDISVCLRRVSWETKGYCWRSRKVSLFLLRSLLPTSLFPGATWSFLDKGLQLK